jgi:hypothetical protein
MNQMAEKHDELVQFVFQVADAVQQTSNLLHLCLKELGKAESAQCSGCDQTVMWPTLEGFVAHPVCPNGNTDPACAEGFSHIPMPEELMRGEEE